MSHPSKEKIILRAAKDLDKVGIPRWFLCKYLWFRSMGLTPGEASRAAEVPFRIVGDLEEGMISAGVYPLQLRRVRSRAEMVSSVLSLVGIEASLMLGKDADFPIAEGGAR